MLFIDFKRIWRHYDQPLPLFTRHFLPFFAKASPDKSQSFRKDSTCVAKATMAEQVALRNDLDVPAVA